MTVDPVYLDHNATTPVLPEVVDAMLPFLREHFGNPSSGHVYGRRAHDAVERARAQVAALLGCDDGEVIFTSGGTEANNLAIRGVPFVLGAGHERGLRPGTENVAAIVALGMACEIAARDLSSMAARTAGLRDELLELLRSEVPGLQLNGHRSLRLPNTLNVRFPGVSGNAVLAGAPEVAASTGSACHAGHEDASAVILAMGVAPGDALGSVRLTLGRGTTREDVARAAAALGRAWRGLTPRPVAGA